MAQEPQQTTSVNKGERPVHAVALRRHLARLCSADQAPWLHGEIARRMAERLSLIKARPRNVVNWWAPLSRGSSALRDRCQGARVIEVAPAGLQPARAHGLWQRLHQLTAPLAVSDAALADGTADLLWSNMGLHWAVDPPALFARWRRVVAVDGYVMFSTLGPGTLLPLQRLYAEQGWGPAMAPLTDMHDLGDMLLAAGFADPVMDQETLTLHWADADSLLRELRTLGGNADPVRLPGLRTPRWLARLRETLLRSSDAKGRVSMPFEVVYGHAFCPTPRATVAAETRIDVETLRTMARSRIYRGSP